MENKYSVLMPLWYKEKPEYLKASIESMANQTIQPSEFVFVRDHELPEELEEVIAKAAGSISVKYVDVYDLFGKGLGGILAKGINACSNELIARMDSDDISFPDRCEKQIKVFIENSEIVLVSGTIAEFSNSTDCITSYRVLPEKNKDILKFSKLRCPFNQPAIMFKKSIIINIGNYNPEFERCEDYELWYRVIKSGYKSYNIQEPILYFRAGNQLIQRRMDKRHQKYYFKLKRIMLEEQFINLFEYQLSVFIQIAFYYSPFTIQKIIYKWLRHKKLFNKAI